MRFMTDRRFVLGSMAAFAVPASARATSHGPGTANSDRLPSSPEEHLDAIVRLIGSRKEENVPWWYLGIVYAQQEGQPPLPLFRIEGAETYWFRHGGDGTYWLSARTLTFIRDFKTKEMIREFDNPLTGEMNDVKPNILGSTDAQHYTPQGILSSWVKSSEEATGSLAFNWRIVGPTVFLIKDRGLPEAPQPWLEAQTPSAPVDAFFDADRDSLPSFFTSTYLAPYPEWMEMGDRPGHVVWHSSGGKLASVNELPAEYLERARAEHPEQLSAEPR